MLGVLLIASRALAGGVEVDGATPTTLDRAPNGVPVVNIANPNKKGLSHNTYRQFNVDRKGLILNNSTNPTAKTKLGGPILGNPNLDSRARIILNEVTSTQPSALNGYTETAGQAADVVIANPNGISVNGAGFINIPRITLTTGVPEIDARGNLTGFDVSGGEIAITGDGLYTGRQDATSIYTYFMQLNAKLHARDLDIALGNNEIDYPGRRVLRSRPGSVQRVLLDSSALGGMYSNRIVLKGTDQGLGVNLPPEVIASSGDIDISNDGRIVLRQLDAGGSIAVQSNTEIVSNDTVFSSRDVTMRAPDVELRDGMIGAGKNLTIEAKEVDNRAAILAGLGDDGSFDNGGQVSIRSAQVANEGSVFSSGGIRIDGEVISNRGLVNASGNLAISADSLANETTLFSGSSMNLHLRDSLDNFSGATIFAVDDLQLAADEGGDKIGRITNDRALMQSYRGDIDIHAERFENLGFADIQYELIYYDLGNGREVSDPEKAKTIDLSYSSGYTKHNNKARRRWINEVLSRLKRQAPNLYDEVAPDIRSKRTARFDAIETRLLDMSTTEPAWLDSGGNLNLQVDDFLNRDAVVAAGGDIHFDIANSYVNETSVKFRDVIDYQYYTRAKHSRNIWSEDKYSSVGRSYYLEKKRRKKVSSDTATQAGGSISGEVNGKTVNSGVLTGKYDSATGIDPADFDTNKIDLPSDEFGLFVKSTSPDSRYLVEINPQFANFDRFINSDYLLDRLDYPGNETLKRLGDAYYEAKLIRDAVFAQTGRRYLDASIKSDNAQFRYLMDNALAAQRELELSPGVSLTTAQIDDLTRDIVWLEEHEVDGQTVLVPRVYLANGPRRQVRGGRILAGENLRLRTASLDNRGLIETGDDTEIRADDAIENQGAIVSSGDLQLEAERSIDNVSGRIEGDNVRLRAVEGSIANRRSTGTYEIEEPDLRYSTTLAGEAGVVKARNRLELAASESILVEGSELSAREVALEAGTIEIETTQEAESFFEGDADSHVRESSVRHFASMVDGDDIVILSPGAVRISGSDVGARNRLRVEAGEIGVSAVSNSEFHAHRDSFGGPLSETVRSDMSYRSEDRGSELDGAAVVLITEHGDIELTASKIHAGDRLEIDSAGSIRVRAGNHSSIDESYEHKSGWLSGGSLYTETEDLEGRVANTAVKSRISAGSVSLDAETDVDLEGVDIGARGSLDAKAAEISVRNAYSDETRYSKHTRIDVGIDGFAGNLTDLDELVRVEDGKAMVKLGEAEYEHAEKTTTETTAVASTIAAGDIRFDAGRETGGLASKTGGDVEAGGNIRVEGSDLLAERRIELNAAGDVALLDAEQTLTTEDKSQHGKADLNLTLQNEYDQAVRAAKAVKKAERDLRSAREAFYAYEEELAAQEAYFEELRRREAAGEGFVERADVDAFERRLERLRDDEDFYRANIALAATTLASKTTALVKQSGQAAASSQTFGFNAGLELDVDAAEESSLAVHRRSRAANLTAREIAIASGETARLRGSNLLADDRIDIAAGDIDVEAGVDASRGEQRRQHVDLTYKWDLLGADSSMDPEDLGGSLSGDGSRSDRDAVGHVQSQVRAANIRLEASGDTRVAGAEIVADETLEVSSGDLRVESVQDTNYSDSRSLGLSHSGAGSGIDAAKTEAETLRTQTTWLGGQSVDIRVSHHTDIRGAVIAATDAEGVDNSQLSLATETLTASSLINSNDDTKHSTSLQAGEFSSLDYEDDRSNETTKSLATLGSGDIRVADTEGSDTRFLNTDIENTEVAIYDIESHQGLSGELDTRLLTEDGRNRIAEDWLKTRIIGNTISLIVDTERVGIEDFFDETARYHTAYEAVKTQVGREPALAAMLQDPALTPEQKEAMLNRLVGTVAAALEYEGPNNVIIATGETTPEGYEFHGYYSTETGQAYINDSTSNSTRDLIVTAGHESVHAMDQQAGIDVSSPGYGADDEAYASDFGTSIADYADFALDYHGHDRLAISNDHADNDSDHVQTNNIEFSDLDKEQGDFYLDYEDKKRYTQYLNALFDCDANGGCTPEQVAKWQPEVVRLLQFDQQTDARLEQACKVASSAVCRAEVARLEKVFHTYRDLEDRRALAQEGIAAEYVQVGTLYGKYRSEAMSENARRALAGMPIDTVTGMVDLSLIAAKASVGDETAKQQLSLISESILEFVKDPVGTTERNIVSQLEEAQRLRQQGDINAAEEIESRVYIEGAIAITGTTGGVINILRASIKTPDIRTGRELTSGIGANIRDTDWFEETALNATRNADSEKLVLGHFSNEDVSYQKVAAHYNATYFKIADWRSITAGLTQDEIWKINETFLKQQLRKGKKILFSHDPNAARPGSYFEKEVRFIKELGYKFKKMNQWTWEAVR
ncbi:MAG: hemagglutinin repeat-containing protein [Gammaproteobacteria bacterium]